MQSKATTVPAYLASLPPDRRAALEAVRRVIKGAVDAKIEEGMQYGMIGYYVPHRIFPDGYHCDPRQPVPYAALASQKNHMSLYLMCAYMEQSVETFIRERYAEAGRRLDMGKSCIRFKSLDELDLTIVRDAIRLTSTSAHLKNYVLMAGPNAWKKKATKKVAKKTKPPAKKR